MIIEQGVIDKATLVWEIAYVHRTLKCRFYEVFFIEYDKYAVPSRKEHHERYIWRCMQEAARVALEDFDRMMRV